MRVLLVVLWQLRLQQRRERVDRVAHVAQVRGGRMDVGDPAALRVAGLLEGEERGPAVGGAAGGGAVGGAGGPAAGEGVGEEGAEEDEEEEPGGEELAEDVLEPVVDVEGQLVAVDDELVEPHAHGAHEEDGGAEGAQHRHAAHRPVRAAEAPVAQPAQQQDAPDEEQRAHDERQQRAVAGLQLVQQLLAVGQRGQQHQQDDPHAEDGGGTQRPLEQQALQELLLGRPRLQVQVAPENHQ